MEEGRAARVEVKGKDEIGRLAAAFNAMAERRERLEELRKAMVGDVAHELRTPLSNIRGWLEAAQDGLADPDPELVASLLEEALLLQRVIDDLQDLAVADAGELRMHTEPVDVADLLTQVATAHRGGAEAARRHPADEGRRPPPSGRRSRTTAPDGGQPRLQRRTAHPARRHREPARPP